MDINLKMLFVLIKRRIKKSLYAKRVGIKMHKFVVTYEIPPMIGELTVDIKAKDEDEALYIARYFLPRAAKVCGARLKYLSNLNFIENKERRNM